MFHKPKGRVPYLKLEPVAFREVLRRGGPLYPHTDGTLKLERSEYREANARTLSYLRNSWGSQLRHFTHIAVALSTGSIERFKATKEVVILNEAPQQIQATANTHFLRRNLEVLGSKPGKQFLKIKYCSYTWSKGAAWTHLVAHPPPQLERQPGISSTDNPYRKNHGDDEWVWVARIPGPRQTLWEIILE